MTKLWKTLDNDNRESTWDIWRWHRNLMEANHVHFHTVAWCRASWGTYPRSRWEVAARTTRREIAVPLPKRPKRATARNYNYVLVSNARPRECAILSQPDARAGRTRGLSYCRAMSDPLVTNWRTGHDTTGRDTTGHNITRWTCLTRLARLTLYTNETTELTRYDCMNQAFVTADCAAYSNQKWNVHLQVAFSWLYRSRSEWPKTQFNVRFVLNLSQ